LLFLNITRITLRLGCSGRRETDNRAGADMIKETHFAVRLCHHGETGSAFHVDLLARNSREVWSSTHLVFMAAIR
jgi:hypothetical protein